MLTGDGRARAQSARGTRSAARDGQDDRRVWRPPQDEAKTADRRRGSWSDAGTARGRQRRFQRQLIARSGNVSLVTRSHTVQTLERPAASISRLIAAIVAA